MLVKGHLVQMLREMERARENQESPQVGREYSEGNKLINKFEKLNRLVIINIFIQKNKKSSVYQNFIN